MDLDRAVRVAVYGHFAETAGRPTPRQIAEALGVAIPEVLAAYGRLRALRILVLEDDGQSIRMAPPFSGVPTQHVAIVGARRYFANCAWDVLGIPAAFGQPGAIESRCAESGEPLRLGIGPDGPDPTDWVFHCAVPAARWWEDIVFT